MNGMIVPSWLITRPAQAQLLLAGEIPSVRARLVVGYVLTGVHEVEPRHLSDNQENRRDRLTHCVSDHPGEFAGQLVQLILGASPADVALNDWHDQAPLSRRQVPALRPPSRSL